MEEDIVHGLCKASPRFVAAPRLASEGTRRRAHASLESGPWGPPARVPGARLRQIFRMSFRALHFSTPGSMTAPRKPGDDRCAPLLYSRRRWIVSAVALAGMPAFARDDQEPTFTTG